MAMFKMAMMYMIKEKMNLSNQIVLNHQKILKSWIITATTLKVVVSASKTLTIVK